MVRRIVRYPKKLSDFPAPDTLEGRGGSGMSRRDFREVGSVGSLLVRRYKLTPESRVLRLLTRPEPEENRLSLSLSCF
jgi:hypothetical protein